MDRYYENGRICGAEAGPKRACAGVAQIIICDDARLPSVPMRMRMVQPANHRVRSQLQRRAACPGAVIDTWCVAACDAAVAVVLRWRAPAARLPRPAPQV